MNTKFYDKPFRHWIISDFTQHVDVLLEALKGEPFQRKECDLFQFFQGHDVSLTKNEILKKFYADFSNPDFLKEITKITGISVSFIDMSPFIYGDTDYLLPHDDRLERRKIAYIVYLNDLSEKEGGHLDFFQGSKIVKSIVPKKGMLALFEVSEKSFHQVSEVISAERISFAGWFHGH